MTLIRYVTSGRGRPSVVFVHGFGCASSDWDAQVKHLFPRHQTVAVDLRGHGETPGTAAECSIEQFAADVAEVMRSLILSPAVIVGHSMGCRVVVEAVLRAPRHAIGLILVDGSQFAPTMETTLRETFAQPDGYATLLSRWFHDMFTAESDPTLAASTIERAQRLPRSIGETLLYDMVRYDVDRLSAALAQLQLPVMVLQSTYSNDKRERRSMVKGQTTAYLEMLRTQVPPVRIEIIAGVGHFPQLEASGKTNALIDSFVATLPVQ
jgi:pimeloyl-ACP methyl ester carboxylesterase